MLLLPLYIYHTILMCPGRARKTFTGTVCRRNERGADGVLILLVLVVMLMHHPTVPSLAVPVESHHPLNVREAHWLLHCFF